MNFILKKESGEDDEPKGIQVQIARESDKVKETTELPEEETEAAGKLSDLIL